MLFRSQDDVTFKDLGLLIIDEEQKFGVSHKEKIKKLKKHVDVLSISATPIPRTMYMALTGAKDFSTIQTPPKNRKPIATTVSEFDKRNLKEAIQKETSRGGQVFYVFNHVSKIEEKRWFLQKLCPKIRIGIGHGQMPEKALHKVMLQFMNHEIDILLCSTIIENGLDVPNANTVIIDGAEHYGLSQIHQIRGRVGRTVRQGYAYLFYDAHKPLSDKARKRLQAIKEYAVLGSGYQLALKDLEIRGSGSLLGHKQHGHMIAIGFDLYCKLLDQSVRSVKNLETRQDIHFSFSKTINTYIPNEYIENERERLKMYQRLMQCETKKDVHYLKEEIEDRYGHLPTEMIVLLDEILKQV